MQTARLTVSGHDDRGVSVVICCHNSAARIQQTVRHLQKQTLPQSIPWEVLVIDNASTDGTVARVQSIWGLSPVTSMRVVQEPRLGLVFARLRGLKSARYQYVSFIDDDNWVGENWVSMVYQVMQAEPRVGACGGLNSAVFEGQAPRWFGEFERSFAVGPQAAERGEITQGPGVLFGAGLSIRKAAWVQLVENGFAFRSTGRKGDQLLCSEDYELCMAIRLAGWKLWYEPELRLKHFMPESRMQWRYLRRLLRGVGESDINLLPYHFAQRENLEPERFLWSKLVLRSIRTLLAGAPKFVQLPFRNLEGDADVLRIERSLGMLKSLLKNRNTVAQSFREISSAGWIRS